MDCVFLKQLIMKKEDFIIGKWYVSSLWHSIKAAKFAGFQGKGIDSAGGLFSFNEMIKEKWEKREYIGTTGTDCQRWDTFREVSISELYLYLPSYHPDLTSAYPECSTNTFSDLSKYKGRYLKALVDYPHGGAVKAGEYGLILDRGVVEFPSDPHYLCSAALSPRKKDKYELMPVGFNPSFPDLVGVYLKALVTNPQGSAVRKGEIVRILSQDANSCKLTKGGYYFPNTFNSDDWEILSEEALKKLTELDKYGNNLEGRYLIALKDNPQSTLLKKGACVKILRLRSKNTYELEKNWTYTIDNITSSHWQLMHEGWVPLKTSEHPVTVQEAFKTESGEISLKKNTSVPVPAIPRLGKSNHKSLTFTPVEVSPVKLKIINNSKYL
jgi:hypothetical protein